MKRPAVEPRRCVAPCTDGHICGAPAPEERIVEDVVMRLCAEHAAELDAERAEESLTN